MQVGVCYCQNYLSEITTVPELILNAPDGIEDFCRIAPADGALLFFPESRY
ncbi:MAG: hypothetical protein F6K36_27445 [Symploca sp. SIO3C6]|uniref:Uncharacterized protein n=1 Tax=Symploca sp. SIO1C4 TaxID=2607765 RepID=A0A6B3NBL5_9CYAN|nr:hypothetical protein [Symploca sp. SIO3C6]NER27434.1 hypothetical protein [Symploca sp. SIO1C4]